MLSTVKIKDHPKTIQLKLNGLTGIVFGETVPSMSGVEVIVGESKKDSAVNVYFDELKQGFWFTEDLLELIDINAGAVASVGQVSVQKQADGSWKDISKKTKKLPVWKRLWRKFGP